MKLKSITTPVDRIIILFVLIISVLLFAVNLITFTPPSVVRIEVDGVLYGEYNLSDTKTITVNSQYGKNVVLIDSKSVCVLETTCKEQYEIGRKISKSGQCIVCLPNRVIIKIEGNEAVDGVTY